MFAKAGTSFRRLARLWYITSTPSLTRMMKPNRSPSGTSTTFSNPSAVQKPRHGSIASTKRTGLNFLTLTPAAMGTSLFAGASENFRLLTLFANVPDAGRLDEDPDGSPAAVDDM